MNLRELLPERIYKKISVSGNGCWDWSAYTDKYGYGTVGWNKKVRKAHRVVYELLIGNIPEGETIDHLCRNRACVNPDHMEIVDNKTNTLRGISFSAINSKKTHCPKGHEYTPDNTVISKGKGRKSRLCLICKRENNRKAQRKYARKNRALLAEIREVTGGKS